MKTTSRHAMCVVAYAIVLSGSALSLGAQEVFSYGFADGAEGWELDDNWGLGSWDLGGQALVEEMNGIAFHTEGSGTLRTVSLRFQMDEVTPYFCFSFGGPGGPAGLSYSVCIEANGIGITNCHS